MTQYLFILIIAATFFSCGSKKKVTNTEIDSTIKEKIDSFIEETKRGTLSIIDISKIEGRVTITETEYDTSTPIDSSTNKPKVKKETITSIDFSKNDSVKTDNVIDNDIKTNINKDKEDINNIKTITEDEKKESSFSYYFHKYVILAGVFLVIVFIFGLYKKFKNYQNSTNKTTLF